MSQVSTALSVALMDECQGHESVELPPIRLGANRDHLRNRTLYGFVDRVLWDGSQM